MGIDLADIQNNVEQVCEAIKKELPKKHVSKERVAMPPSWNIYVHEGQKLLSTVAICDSIFEDNENMWKDKYMTQFLEAASLENGDIATFNAKE